MSSLKLLHSGGNGVIISAPSSNPAANRTITLNDTYAGDGSFVTANSSGNVGIGTASPSTILHCSSSSNTGIFAQSTNSGNSASTNYQTPNRIFYTGIDIGGTNSSYTIYDGTAGAERMRISSSGDLKIATTTDEPGNGNTNVGITARSNGRFFTSANGTFNCFNRNSSDGALFVFARQGTHVGNISVTSSSTSYNSGSDYRLKENVAPISDGITRLKTLKPSRFNFKVDTDTTVDGFLAHEVTAVPEAITGTKDEVDSDNKPVYQAIDQSKLVPLLTAALQEAVAKIEVLETKVAALEGA